MEKKSWVLVAILVLGVVIVLGSISNKFSSESSSSQLSPGGNQNLEEDDNSCPDVEGCRTYLDGGFSGPQGSFEKAKEKALADCEARLREKINECNTKILEETAICLAAECQVTISPMNTGGPCVVTQCEHFTGGEHCVYKVENGELVEPGVCRPYPSSKEGWSCSTKKGDHIIQSIACTPVPGGEGGTGGVGGGSGDN